MRQKVYFLKDGSVYTRANEYVYGIEDLNDARLHGNRFITLEVDNDNLKQVMVAIDDIEKIELREIEDEKEVNK